MPQGSPFPHISTLSHWRMQVLRAHCPRLDSRGPLVTPGRTVSDTPGPALWALCRWFYSFSHFMWLNPSSNARSGRGSGFISLHTLPVLWALKEGKARCQSHLWYWASLHAFPQTLCLSWCECPTCPQHLPVPSCCDNGSVQISKPENLTEKKKFAILFFLIRGQQQTQLGQESCPTKGR